MEQTIVLIKITKKQKVGIGRITETRKDRYKKEKYKPKSTIHKEQKYIDKKV